MLITELARGSACDGADAAVETIDNENAGRLTRERLLPKQGISVAATISRTTLLCRTIHEPDAVDA